MFFGIPLQLWLVCLIVVIGRIIDMSLATIRTVFSVKGKSGVAGLLGFVEAFFWFIVVKAALDYVGSAEFVVRDTFALAISYSLGFALGTFLGGILSKCFISGTVKVQIVLTNKDDEFVNALKEEHFGATIITAQGVTKKDEKYLVYVETSSKKLKTLRAIVEKYDPKAFVSVNEIKEVHNGYFGNTK